MHDDPIKKAKEIERLLEKKKEKRKEARGELPLKLILIIGAIGLIFFVIFAYRKGQRETKLEELNSETGNIKVKYTLMDDAYSASFILDFDSTTETFFNFQKDTFWVRIPNEKLPKKDSITIILKQISLRNNRQSILLHIRKVNRSALIDSFYVFNNETNWDDYCQIILQEWFFNKDNDYQLFPGRSIYLDKLKFISPGSFLCLFPNEQKIDFKIKVTDTNGKQSDDNIFNISSSTLTKNNSTTIRLDVPKQ